jgi:hypothetical protein
MATSATRLCGAAGGGGCHGVWDFGGVKGDQEPPNNDPTIAVAAWGAMMIAGAAFLVLSVVWVVIAALKVRQRSRTKC